MNMPEDAGKKKFIRDFLQRVKSGEGFVEDIWIERVIRPETLIGEEGSVAKSLSGRAVSDITSLLEDDISHCFREGYFTFRIISALRGSGKTSLITYLHELIKTKPEYQKFSIIVRFPLTNLISLGGSQTFTIKFYCYILSESFWQLLNCSNLPIKDLAKKILHDYYSESQPKVNDLLSSKDNQSFRSNFIKLFSESPLCFEEFFFDLIKQVSETEPRYNFSFLIDEFDGLEHYPNQLRELSCLMRALVKRAVQDFSSKIHLLIYLAGTSENITSFFKGDPVLESLIYTQVVNLNSGYSSEFDQIKYQIEKRIEGAFKGYKNFPKAWQEIKDIQTKPGLSLREFCQNYASPILSIHEKYFKEEVEKEFEGNARELVESRCRQEWKRYLSQQAYTLSSVSTTTILSGHAFDCYMELLHNGSRVARGFGEAKNYELLSSHLHTLKEWLEDVGFCSVNPNGTPHDLAFMIAPSCPHLLSRKLELENIIFIQAGKIGYPDNDSSTKKTEVDLSKKNVPELKRMAKERNIPRFSRMKKDELVRRLSSSSTV